MNDIRTRNRIFIFGVALLLRATQAGTEAPPGWAAAWDYLVQDVCTNTAGSSLRHFTRE